MFSISIRVSSMEVLADGKPRDAEKVSEPEAEASTSEDPDVLDLPF
jgi:hypothetical protein